VFKSLGLIKKTSINETKKPAFSWIGIIGLDSFAAKIKLEKESQDLNSILNEEIEDKSFKLGSISLNSI
jgi:transcription factor E2F7/8